jgi:hypothetical protein
MLIYNPTNPTLLWSKTYFLYTYILLALKLSLISMSLSYLHQFVSILPTVLHINIMLSSLKLAMKNIIPVLP